MKILNLPRVFREAIFVLLFLFIASAALAQRGATHAAEKAYQSGDYYDAITLYKKAYTKEKNKAKRAEIIFLVAESYRHINDYKNQEVWYAKAIKANLKNPKAVLYLAYALKFNGKYDEAIVKYTDYKKLEPSDPEGDLGVQSCEQAQKWKDHPTRYRVDNVAAINSKYFDFGATYSNKDKRHIIFTSSRIESVGKTNDGGTGEKFQDLFEASVDKKGKWSSPKPLPDPVNTTANEGSATLNTKGDEMYFTRCDYEKGKIGVCDIYYTKRNNQGWDAPNLISLGPDSVVVAQPSLSTDGQILYFVSNMPGGQGGYDLWMCRWNKKDKKWDSPTNLGNKVNTPEDEMFPYSSSDGTLYFSSKGHIGMGGLDIFRTKMTGSAWDEPINLKYPINTSADDFAFIIDDTGEHGFLSSNRDGGKGNDDIYQWYLPPLVFTVSGKVYDADSKANIENARVELFSSDGGNIPYNTDKTGTYKFDLKPETDYKIVASLKNYLSKQYELSTKGLEQSKDFIGDFDFAMKSTLRAIELPNILYDLGKWDLRQESKTVLDALVQTLNDNPTIVIELGSHTDSRPIPMSNDTLSQRRAESVVDYLVEKGIDHNRLDAHGYGQRQPRVLDRDMGSFHKGDSLSDDFIASLKKTPLKEEAHQLNRRTEFRVLRANYIKGQKAEDQAPLNQGNRDSTGMKMQKDTGISISDDRKNIIIKTELSSGAATEAAAKGPGEIYVAEKKDTYSSIAKKYNMDAQTLKKLNGLKAELIYEGMELKVDPNGDYSDYDKKFYILEKGETKWKDIAKNLGIKEGELKKMNKNVEEGQLKPGKKIRISK